MALRAQLQMLILALYVAVHISFTLHFNCVKALVPDLILYIKLAKSHKVTRFDDVTFNV